MIKMRTAKMKEMDWEETDVQFLMDNYQTMSQEEMAIELNIPVARVKNKCTRQGLYTRKQK